MKMEKKPCVALLSFAIRHVRCTLYTVVTECTASTITIGSDHAKYQNTRYTYRQ